MKVGMQVGLDARHFVFDGDPALPPPTGGGAPNFGPYLLWPTGWIKMPTGREVGLGPSGIVLDGDI